jgi:7-carboxy-7-deazaguanine synthase
MLKINEIFHSIQGESSRAGEPCVFIRLTGCNLRCSYCDTEYAFYDGKSYSVDDIIAEVEKYNCRLVEVTGGEPLLQEDTLNLMNRLCDDGFEVMLETGGSLPVDSVDGRVKIILDMKCPSSGMTKKNLYANLNWIKTTDEVKFVIGNREDYEWSKNVLEEYGVLSKAAALFSPVFGKLEPSDLAKWILEDKLNVRFQIQIQKYIWDPTLRGV